MLNTKSNMNGVHVFTMSSLSDCMACAEFSVYIWFINICDPLGAFIAEVAKDGTTTYDIDPTPHPGVWMWYFY